ncbi:MAG: hypothetical protein AB7P49_19690, partial [Bdellovibrionales bacterium]
MKPKAVPSLVLGAVWVWCSLVGCVPSHGLTWRDHKPPPQMNVSQIATTWDNQVHIVPDPIHPGQSVPSLSARVYLFGSNDGHPVLGDGEMVVQMFYDTVGEQGPQRIMLEQWQLPNSILAKLVNKDMIGWGYSITLPWTSHNISIANVEMVVAYRNSSGNQTFASSRLRLQHDRRLFRMTRTIQPINPVHPQGHSVQPVNPLQPQGPSVQPVNP